MGRSFGEREILAIRGDCKFEEELSEENYLTLMMRELHVLIPAALRSASSAAARLACTRIDYTITIE